MFKTIQEFCQYLNDNYNLRLYASKTRNKKQIVLYKGTDSGYINIMIASPKKIYEYLTSLNLTLGT